MSTPKHTPGPLHNGQPSVGQPCTCCILLRTGEPLESIHGKQPCADISRIELCPKHAAAPAMYEEVRAAFELLIDLRDRSTTTPAYQAIIQKRIDSMMQTLAQAEDKP